MSQVFRVLFVTEYGSDETFVEANSAAEAIATVEQSFGNAEVVDLATVDYC